MVLSSAKLSGRLCVSFYSHFKLTKRERKRQTDKQSMCAPAGENAWNGFTKCLRYNLEKLTASMKEKWPTLPCEDLCRRYTCWGPAGWRWASGCAAETLLHPARCASHHLQHTHIHACSCISTHIHHHNTCFHTHTHIYTHTHTHIHTHTCLCITTHNHQGKMFWTHTHTHTYTHTVYA